MWNAGDAMNNPMTGTRAVVRLGRADTGDDRVVLDLFVPPGASLGAEHVHPSLGERIEVLSGRVGYALGGRGGLALRGDVLDIPAGTVHDWWNAGEQEAHVRLDVWPAARFELLVETLFGLAAEGRTDARGTPGLLQRAVLARDFAPEVVAARSRPVRAALRALAPLARLLGRRATYPQHRELLLRYGSARVAEAPAPEPVVQPLARVA